MQHYQIGQKIGEFTITSFTQGIYTLTCTCGNTSSGDSTHVTRKIANIMAEGFSSCSTCSGKMRVDLKTLQNNNAQVYTFKDVYREYVKKSKERNVNFEVSLEEASKYFVKNCHYCNRPPLNLRKRDSGIEVYYQGLDRVDNSIGYTSTNIVPCCKYCNSFKNDRSLDEFLTHVKEIYLNKVQRLSLTGVGSSEPKWETPHVGEDIV